MADAAINSECTPMAFAVAKNLSTCSSENGHLATLRFTFQGSRKVTLVPTRQFLDCATKIKGKQIALNDLQKTFNKLTASEVKAFSEFAEQTGMQIFQGTVGANDLLSTPAGYTFF